MSAKKVEKAENPKNVVTQSEKIALGVGSAVGNWAIWTPKLMGNQVFNMHLHVNPSYLSLGYMIFRFIDALTDPITGWLSDRTRSRWGRRRPWIFIGGILLGLSFPALWFVNPEWDEMQIVAWFIVVGCIHYLVTSIWDMPYNSLTLEMTPNYNERTNINAYRSAINQIFSLGYGWIWYITQLDWFVDPATGEADTLAGMRAVSIVMGLLIMILGVVPAIVCKERYYETSVLENNKTSLLKGLVTTLKNRSFKYILLLIICMSISSASVGGFSAYINKYYVCGGDEQMASYLSGIGHTCSSLTALLAAPIIFVVSSRIGKIKTTRILLLGLLLIAAFSWFCYTPSFPWLSIVPYMLTAPAMAGFWILIPSMNADIVDEDELALGERREGVYTAVFSWGMKVAATLGVGIAGPLLVMTGFDATLEAEQTSEALILMRIAMIFVPLAGVVLGLLCLSKLEITPERAEQIRQELEARRGKIE